MTQKSVGFLQSPHVKTRQFNVLRNRVLSVEQAVQLQQAAAGQVAAAASYVAGIFLHASIAPALRGGSHIAAAAASGRRVMAAAATVSAPGGEVVQAVGCYIVVPQPSSMRLPQIDPSPRTTGRALAWGDEGHALAGRQP